MRQNDPERTKRLKDTAELAASIAEVKRADAVEKKAKKIKTTGGLLDEARRPPRRSSIPKAATPRSSR